MKNKIAVLSFALALIVAIALPAFGQTIVPTTTLSTAVTTTGGTTVVVASATGITANNTYLYVDGEYMAVNSVNSTTLTVTRGYNSTRAATHKSGALVWNGPSTYFQWASPIGYPSGSCTRTGNILPWIDVNNSIISDCLGGVWVNGVNAPLPSAVTLNAYTGGTIYTSIDSTGTTLAATTMYCSEVNLPYNRYLTGIGILNGTSVATDKHLVALYDWLGIWWRIVRLRAQLPLGRLANMAVSPSPRNISRSDQRSILPACKPMAPQQRCAWCRLR